MILQDKNKVQTCRTCEKLFMETGALNRQMILHDEEKAHTCRTCEKLFMKTGTLNKHKILHDEQKAQNLQDIWEIIHEDWDLEQTQDFT